MYEAPNDGLNIGNRGIGCIGRALAWPSSDSPVERSANATVLPFSKKRALVELEDETVHVEYGLATHTRTPGLVTPFSYSAYPGVIVQLIHCGE